MSDDELLLADLTFCGRDDTDIRFIIEQIEANKDSKLTYWSQLLIEHYHWSVYEVNELSNSLTS